jgi:hypothetical protein
MAPGDPFHPLHVERSGSFTVRLPPERAFPFFSPEGERSWVLGWVPVYLHPVGPSTAPGTVFRTDHNDEETQWEDAIGKVVPTAG